jgi:hypothetical protein
MFDNGSLIFLIFLVIGFVGLVVGYYTRKGSGINPRPYGKVYGGAPGANTRGEVSGKDPRERYSTRGTR